MPIDRSPTRGDERSDLANTSTDRQEAAGRRREHYVDRVAVRAPPFWSEEPELWFAQLESQFALNGITQDSTKYAHILSQLDTKQAREVKDIITNPPETNKYTAIKLALIQRVSASQEQRTRQLLEHEELGDRKPSQFLRHLRTLAGPSLPEQLLRTLWLGRLPAQMQVILATRAQDPLEDIAEQADRIQEVSSRTINEVAAPKTECIAEQLSKLALQVAELDKRIKFPQKRNRRRSRSREKKTQAGDCYYHRRFGDKARKCTQPCNFQAGNTQDDH